MIASLIASIVIGTNSVTFTATATGVAKETPVEFMFVGKGSDRDYEAMFVLDDPIASFADALEKAGIPRGTPTDVPSCRLWSVGVPLTLTPDVDAFVERQPIEGDSYPPVVYTGGSRDASGKPLAEGEMPQAAFALFDCAQSVLHYDAILPQGLVYGKQLARKGLEKGERTTFTLAWDGVSRVRHLELEIAPGNLSKAIRRLKDESAKGPIDVLVSFADNLTVGEASAVSAALSLVDSRTVKLNGFKSGNFFYRAFAPLVKWRDRKERLTQPFEIFISESTKLFFIDEDWSVEGPDPALTPREIPFEESVKHPKTDTAFIYAPKCTTIAELKTIKKRMPESVRTWYVYAE